MTTATAARIADAMIADKQKIRDLDLDDLYEVVKGHTDRCGYCDAHTLCARGVRIVEGVNAVVARAG